MFEIAVRLGFDGVFISLTLSISANRRIKFGNIKQKLIEIARASSRRIVNDDFDKLVFEQRNGNSSVGDVYVFETLVNVVLHNNLV